MNNRSGILLLIAVVLTGLLTVFGLYRLKTSMDHNMVVFHKDLRDSRLMGFSNKDRVALSAVIPPLTRQIAWSPVDNIYYLAVADSSDANVSQMYTLTEAGELRNLPETPEVRGDRKTATALAGVTFHGRTKKVYFVAADANSAHIVYDPKTKQMTRFDVKDSWGQSIVYHKKSDRLYVLNFPYLMQVTDDDLEPERYFNLEGENEVFEQFPKDGYDEQFSTNKPESHDKTYVMFDDGDEIAAVETYANSRERLSNLSKHLNTGDVGLEKVEVYKVHPEKNRLLFETLSTK